jgi:hypothetical protein
MNVSFNLVGMVMGAAPAQAGKAPAASYEQVIAAVEKNLNLEEFSSDLRIEFSRGGKEPKIWTAHLLSSRDYGGVKIADFYGQREDGLVLRRKGEQFTQCKQGKKCMDLGENAAKAGVFDTDYSFKDVLELTRLADEYDKKTFEEADYGGRKCFHLVLEAKPGKRPFYHKREMWVDQQTMVPLKMAVFGSADLQKPLKTITVTEHQLFQGINYPVEITVQSGFQNTATRIVISGLKALSPQRTELLKYINRN